MSTNTNSDEQNSYHTSNEDSGKNNKTWTSVNNDENESDPYDFGTEGMFANNEGDDAKEGQDGTTPSVSNKEAQKKKTTSRSTTTDGDNGISPFADMDQLWFDETLPVPYQEDIDMDLLKFISWTTTHELLIPRLPGDQGIKLTMNDLYHLHNILVIGGNMDEFLSFFQRRPPDVTVLVGRIDHSVIRAARSQLAALFVLAEHLSGIAERYQPSKGRTGIPLYRSGKREGQVNYDALRHLLLSTIAQTKMSCSTPYPSYRTALQRNLPIILRYLDQMVDDLRTEDQLFKAKQLEKQAQAFAYRQAAQAAEDHAAAARRSAERAREEASPILHTRSAYNNTTGRGRASNSNERGDGTKSNDDENVDEISGWKNDKPESRRSNESSRPRSRRTTPSPRNLDMDDDHPGTTFGGTFSPIRSDHYQHGAGVSSEPYRKGSFQQPPDWYKDRKSHQATPISPHSTKNVSPNIDHSSINAVAREFTVDTANNLETSSMSSNSKQSRGSRHSYRSRSSRRVHGEDDRSKLTMPSTGKRDMVNNFQESKRYQEYLDRKVVHHKLGSASTIEWKPMERSTFPKVRKRLDGALRMVGMGYLLDPDFMKDYHDYKVRHSARAHERVLTYLYEKDKNHAQLEADREVLHGALETIFGETLAKRYIEDMTDPIVAYHQIISQFGEGGNKAVLIEQYTAKVNQRWDGKEDLAQWVDNFEDGFARLHKLGERFDDPYKIARLIQWVRQPGASNQYMISHIEAEFKGQHNAFSRACDWIRNEAERDNAIARPTGRLRAHQVSTDVSQLAFPEVVKLCVRHANSRLLDIPREIWYHPRFEEARALVISIRRDLANSRQTGGILNHHLHRNIRRQMDRHPLPKRATRPTQQQVQEANLEFRCSTLTLVRNDKPIYQRTRVMYRTTTMSY